MRNTILSVFVSLLAIHAAAQAEQPDAKEILQKTLAAYAGAKSYQGNWIYAQQQGKAVQKVTMEVKAKGPIKLYIRIAPAPGQKPAPGAVAVPELLIVLDGKNAWFQNVTEKVFYKVTPSENWKGSPLLFFPGIPAASEAKRGKDLQEDGKTVYVVEAATTDGGFSRMEIDAATYHIRRIAAEKTVGIARVVSTITVDKETFDADIPDSAFNFKQVKGAKEINPPLEAFGMFGMAPPGKR
jgi:outer membrane lipoprotein-sorting protein